MTTEELSRLPDAELFALAEAVAAECRRRERESARFDKGRASKAAKRDPRCPKCSVRLWKDGKRKDGVQTYVCPVCGSKSCDAANTSLASSKLPMATIEKAITLIMLDCPDWVASWILGVNAKNHTVLEGPLPRRKPRMGDGIEAFRPRLDRRDALRPRQGRRRRGL